MDKYIIYFLGASYQAEQSYKDTGKSHWKKAWRYAAIRAEKGLRLLEVK